MVKLTQLTGCLALFFVVPLTTLAQDPIPILPAADSLSGRADQMDRSGQPDSTRKTTTEGRANKASPRNKSDTVKQHAPIKENVPLKENVPIQQHIAIIADVSIKENLPTTEKDTAGQAKKADSIKQAEKPTLKIGGALRFNYNLSSWKKEQVKRGGDFGLDMFRINVDASHKKLDFHAEYRFYAKASGGSFLKDGYLTYHFNDSTNLAIGLVQNPFGNTTYNSHNWFFNLPYYLGFEDKASMGIRFHQRSNRWMYDLAFFKSAMELDFGDKTSIDPSRYSYDVAGRNKEVNQGNVKTEYLLSENKRIGISGMLGGVYNIPTGNMGSRWAAAIHTDLTFGKFNVKLQSMYYQYQLADSAQYNQTVNLGAYGATYDVATKAYLHTASVAFTQPVKIGPLNSITFYENYSYMDKTQKGSTDTQMNVLGMMLNAGNLVTYVDWASGKNQPWLGPEWQNGLASGNPDAKWHSRFNINIGYYF